MKSFGFIAFMFAFPLFLFSSEPLTVGSLDTGYAGTNNTDETVSDRLLIEGSLRKVGDGTLTLPLSKVSSINGNIHVLDGTLAATADGAAYELAEKPAALLAKAAFWVDANTNVVTFISNDVTCVSQWLDVRELNQAGPYQYLRAVSKTDYTNAFPSLFTTGAGLSNSLAYVYCGGYKSCQWMEWQNAASNVAVLTTIRNVFIVHGAHTSYGFLLGNNAEPADFHKGSTGDSGLASPLWTASWEAAKVKTGRTFLDRQRVDGTVIYPKQGYQLLEAEAGNGVAIGAGQGATACNFFNDRNIHTIQNSYRQGGDRLCEVLIYTNRITEAERLQIEQYLWQKWFSTVQDAPGLSVAYGLSASVNVASGMTLSVMRLRGDGTFVKSGTGTLRTDVTTNTPPFNGQVRLDAGLLDMRLQTPIQAAGGTRLSVNTNILTVAAAGDASQLTKSGTGELVLRDVPSGITNIAVEQGILQLTQPLASTVWPTNTAGIIPNHSFEFGTTYNYGNGETYGGWTAFIPADGSFQPAVWIQPQWLVPCPAPDGTYMLMLKGYVHAETTLTLPADGVYVLSFLASARAGEYPEFDILIDGTCRVATVQTLPTEYQRYRYRLPWLTAGAHTLRLQSVAVVDKTAALDDFHADLLTAARPLNVMSNASFECVAYTAGQTETNAPAGTGWDFTTSGSNTAVIASVGGAHCLIPDYGRRILCIKNQGSASTTMTFPESGAYQLAFNIAKCRSLLNGEITSSQQVTVNVGGVNVGTLTTEAMIFTPANTAPFTVTAGVPVTLALTGTATDNRLLLIDDITARKYGAFTGNLIQNGGFESGTTGWSMIYDTSAIPKMAADLIAYSNNTNAFGTAVFEGATRLRLVQTGLAKQTVAFALPGTYRLTFHAVARVQSGSPITMGKNPVVAWVSRAGITNRIGYVMVDEVFFRRHEFFFTVPVAGSYDIGLQGQDSTPTGDRTAFIDGVSVEKVDLAAPGTILPKPLRLDIASDAKLNLNYIGTNTFELVRYAGKTLAGTITSETHPEFVYGAGAIHSPPKGTLLMFQ